MRLWSIHPCYLDSMGLVALWRETLLAQAVLKGETKGYKFHPQLERFKKCSSPQSAIASYLTTIYNEALSRGYSFNKSKIGTVHESAIIQVTSGQLEFERIHLMQKLNNRSKDAYNKWHTLETLEQNPMFEVYDGKIELWEKATNHE